MLGAHGDIAIVLPCLKKWADEHGVPASLLVAKEYLPMLEGVSYVRAVEWPGKFTELKAALRFLREELPDIQVVNLQFFQSGYEKALPSFADEYRWLAGKLKGWEEMPLVFDKRDTDREYALVKRVLRGSKKRLILVATKAAHGHPFKHGARLLRKIRMAFPKFKVVALSRVRASRIYDLLGLYDYAAALVTIDTAHVHLSRASSVPTFVLAQDKPETWHGSPFERRFKFHCRYGDYVNREAELIGTLRNVLAGNEQPKLEPIQGLKPHAYNPSLVLRRDRQFIASRHHHSSTWETRLEINGKRVVMPRQFDKYSQEDMRLFKFKGDLYGSFTLSKWPKGKMPLCITGYGRLHESLTMWEITEPIIPRFLENDFKHTVKNVVFFQSWDKLCAIFTCDKAHVVYELDGAKIINMHLTKGPGWPYGEMRGGTTPLPFKDGTMIRFFHSRTMTAPRPSMPWRYHIGAYEMEAQPPFRILRVSRHPILTANEWTPLPTPHHWKTKIVFPGGAIEDGDGWLVAVGVNDCQSALMRVTEEQLNL